MKVELDEKNLSIVKEKLTNFAKNLQGEYSEEVLMKYDKELYTYIKRLYMVIRKRCIDKYLLKLIVEVTQSELSGDTEYFLIQKYGLDTYMRIKVDELGYPD